MLARLRSLIRALFGRRQFEDDLSDELRFHLDAQVDDLVRSGVDPQEAMRRARAAFGSVESIKEDARRSRGLRYYDEIRQDLRYGVRQLKRAPGFTSAALLSLAVGIGANAAIFSLLDFVVIGQVPVRDPQALYFLGHGTGATPSLSSNVPLLERYQRDADVFSGVTAYNVRQFKVQSAAGTELVDGQYVAGNYHDVLGARFTLGRGFSSEPDRPSSSSFIAVISSRFWERRFGRAAGVIGQTLIVDGKPVTIVGVTAPGFHGLRPGTDLEVTLPLALRIQESPGYATMRDTWTSLNIVGRARPGITEAQALAGTDRVFQTFWKEPENAWAQSPSETSHPARLTPAGRGTAALRTAYAEPLRILMGMVGLVLLVASANVANLLTVRGVARRRELAIRLSIGAARARLVRQLLTESLLLAVAGGVLGLLVAMWGTTAIAAILNEGGNPILVDVDPNARVLGFTIAISLLTGVVFGLAPALRATRVDLSPALKPGGHAGGRLQRLASGKVLVAGQVAISMLLLAGTGLLVRSLINLKTLDPGFDRDKLLLFWFDTRGTQSELMALYPPLLDRLQSLPGVRSASISTMSPLATNSETRGISVAGPAAAARPRGAVSNRVTADYFPTLDIPIRRGRGFAADAGADRVAVVNETMARAFFDGEPLGRTFWFGAAPAAPITVIGVARDVRQFKMQDPVQPMVYVRLDQTDEPQSLLTAVVRTRGEPRSLEAAVKSAVQATSPDLVISYMRTMDEQVDTSLMRERLLATLSVAFGTVGLVLAVVGLYGVMAYAVAHRLREFAIRLALGATGAMLVRRVLWESIVVIVPGIAVGLAGAAVATKLVSTFLYGLGPTDPATFGAAAGVLLATSLAAGYLPARRAAAADPARALKSE